jgi:Kef-type K+ transport system membrane component KefB
MILYRFRKTREQSYQLIILLGILALYLMVIILATLVSIEINNKPTIANPLVTILDIALIIACIRWPTGKRKVT